MQQIGVAEKLLYLKKPFQPEEIRQLARALTEKWNLTQRERERLLLTNRLMNESTALTRGVQRNLGETARAILGAFVSFLDADLGIVARTLHGELEVCAITHPAQQGALVERISAVGMPERRRTDDTAQTAYFPIRFEDFEGFIYLEGKGISFDFEQLEPFLDILSETAREVLKNMFLLQQHSREKRLAVLGTAMQTHRWSHELGTGAAQGSGEFCAHSRHEESPGALRQAGLAPFCVWSNLVRIFHGLTRVERRN